MGLRALPSAVRRVEGVQGVLVPRVLLPLGCCEVLHARGAVTGKGSVPSMESSQKRPVSFAGGFGPVAIISRGVPGDCTPLA